MDETNNSKMENEKLVLSLKNTIKSLREQLISQDQIHAQELTETRACIQEEIKKIDGRLTEKYEIKLQLSLQKLRDQYEGQVLANSNDIEILFNSKIKKLQNSVQHNETGAVIEELLMTHSRIDSLNSKIGQLEEINSLLNARIRDLEALVDSESARIRDSEALLDVERARRAVNEALLREKITRQFKEYNELRDAKLSLDLKIANIEILSENKEQPLNVTPTIGAIGKSLSDVGSSGLKRKRTNDAVSKKHSPYGLIVAALAKGDVKILETVPGRQFIKLHDTRGSVAIRCWDIVRFNDAATESTDCNVEILEVDPEAKFIKLYNKSDQAINIGGWKIIQMTNVNKTQFIFHHLIKIQGNGVITIWSDDGVKQHEASVNIVMKTKKWFVDDYMKTQLLNNDDVIVHTRVVAKF